MANLANLLATIAANVYTNHNNEVTAQMVKDAMGAIVSTMGQSGYIYKGLATTSTNPSSPDANVFYIATAAGTYTNFGGIVVNAGEVAILRGTGTSWSKDVTGAATSAKLTELDQKVGMIIYEDTISVSSSTISQEIPCSIPAGKTLRMHLAITGGTYTVAIRLYKADNTYINKNASGGLYDEDYVLPADIVKIHIVSYLAVSGTSVYTKIQVLGLQDDVSVLQTQVSQLDTLTASHEKSIIPLLSSVLKTSTDVSMVSGQDVRVVFVGDFIAGQSINVKLSGPMSEIVLASIDSSNNVVETFLTLKNHRDFDITLSSDAVGIRFLGVAQTTANITITLCKNTYTPYVKKQNSSSAYNPSTDKIDKYIKPDGTLDAAYVLGVYQVTDYIDITEIDNLYGSGCRMDSGAVTYAVYDNAKNFIRSGDNVRKYTHAVGEKYVRYCMKTAESRNITIGSSAAAHKEECTEHYYLFERMFDLYARPCVSLVADDFVYGDYDYAGYGHTATEQEEAFHDALVNAGLVCDVAASYNLLGTEEKRGVAMDWEKEGFQFIFHPIHSHWFPGDGGLDLAAARAQVVPDIVATRCSFPARHRVFIYPGDSDRYGAESIVRDYFDCGITWENGANWQRPYSDGPGRYKIKRFNIQIGVKGTQTIAQMKASIDQAVAENGWIIFGMHPHWLDLDGVEPTNPEKFTIANLMDVINYALTASGTTKLVHVEDEWERRKPLYDFLGL